MYISASKKVFILYSLRFVNVCFSVFYLPVVDLAAWSAKTKRLNNFIKIQIFFNSFFSRSKSNRSVQKADYLNVKWMWKRKQVISIRALQAWIRIKWILMAVSYNIANQNQFLILHQSIGLVAALHTSSSSRYLFQKANRDDTCQFQACCHFDFIWYDSFLNFNC